MKPVDTSVKWP